MSYAEISTVNKIDNKTFSTYQTIVQFWPLSPSRNTMLSERGSRGNCLCMVVILATIKTCVLAALVYKLHPQLSSMISEKK